MPATSVTIDWQVKGGMEKLRAPRPHAAYFNPYITEYLADHDCNLRSELPANI